MLQCRRQSIVERHTNRIKLKECFHQCQNALRIQNFSVFHSRKILNHLIHASIHSNCHAVVRVITFK